MSALRPGGRAPGRARPRGRVAGARRAVWGLGCRPTPSRRADARRSGTAQGRRRAGGGGRRRASAGASGQRGERGRVNRRFPVNWSADALAGSSQQAKNVRRWRATHTRFRQRHGTHEVRTQGHSNGDELSEALRKCAHAPATAASASASSSSSLLSSSLLSLLSPPQQAYSFSIPKHCVADLHSQGLLHTIRFATMA